MSNSSGGASNGGFEVMELSESSKAEHLAHLASMRLLEIQTRARSMMVPTVADEVKQMLRERRQPVTLFGENALDRRERLKQVLAEAEVDREARGEGTAMDVDTSSSSLQVAGGSRQHEEKAKATYTQCGEEMIAARKFLTTFSFDRAKSRLQKESSSTTKGGSHNDMQEILCKKAASMQLNASAVSEQRPLMKVRFDPSGNYIATGSLGSHLKVWDAKTLQTRKLFVGHTERIMGVAWHPEARITDSGSDHASGKKPTDKKKRKRSGSNSVNESPPSSSSAGPSLLASASADGKCLIWDCNLGPNAGESQTETTTAPVLSLTGHDSSVTHCAFHPAGKHIITAGVDYSWRYWDLTSGKELLLQDGHPSECTSIAPHPDGSLLLSTDSSGYAFMWDLRSGKRILVLNGHADKITSSCWHPNGYEAATASLDNMVRLWDIRKQGCKYQLPAHSEAITDARFSSSGTMLLSSSFDGAINVFSTAVKPLVSYYPRLACLKGHSGKVMGADFSPDETSVVSVGFDRTVKLWTFES